MDLTTGLVRELEQKAAENAEDPQALLEILYDLTTWSNDDVAELQKWIIEQISGELDASLTRTPTDVPTADGSANAEQWPDVGLLGSLGYKVGKSGLPVFRRHATLRNAFECEAENFIAKPQAMAWGSPKSPTRLQKIANSLAAFAGNARKKEGDYSAAIEHWESDLQFLKNEYSQDFQRVNWPATTSSVDSDEDDTSQTDLFGPPD
jgi:hypothetical protein